MNAITIHFIASHHTPPPTVEVITDSIVVILHIQNSIILTQTTEYMTEEQKHPDITLTMSFPSTSPSLMGTLFF